MTKAMNMLGLCARAGKIVSGEKAVDEAVKKGGAFLVLVDGAISETGKKALDDACRFRNVERIVTPEGELGRAIGRPGRMAVAVTEKGFAEHIALLARETHM
jgi:ribosomal protein L7Ae-like RNA K-turn-binding protein